MTDTEKATLEVRIDELCAELGKTQLNCDMWHDRAEDMRNRLSAAQVKNDRLQKLVQYMWPMFIGERRATFADILHVRTEMNELGVE